MEVAVGVPGVTLLSGSPILAVDVLTTPDTVNVVIMIMQDAVDCMHTDVTPDTVKGGEGVKSHVKLSDCLCSIIRYIRENMSVQYPQPRCLLLVEPAV